MYTHNLKTKDLESGMKVAESAYALTSNGTNMLEAPKGTVLTDTTIAMLERKGVKNVAVLSKKPPPDHDDIAQGGIVYQDMLDKLGPAPETIVPPIKPIIDEKLKKEAIESVRRVFTFSSLDDEQRSYTTAHHCVTDLERVTRELLGVVKKDPNGLIHIHGLKRFDEYTYHHSLSVALLSITIGQELGLGPHELFRLGRCAMLHDIGKQLVPIEVLNKRGKLTAEEFEKVKDHALLGANNLKANGIGDMELWHGVMFHHEKLNGSGYPRQIDAKEIPIFSKIISVADVYDAVTSYRPYRSPMIPAEAYELINSDIGKAFEYDVVSAMFRKLEFYPLYTVVELSDKRFGVVIDNQNALRPTVKIWVTKETVKLSSPNNLNVTIVRVLESRDLPRGPTTF